MKPWEILGISPGSDEQTIRKAFRTKAKQFHPDKGGSAEDFKELYDAYTMMTDMREEDASNDDDMEWFGWMARWMKRFLGTDNSKVLKIKIPWKLLEDRDETIKIEFDGLPVGVYLGHTETIALGGLRVKLIPNASICWEADLDEKERIEKAEEPWFQEKEWLFLVPQDAKAFRVEGGEWSENEGEYGRGVHWRRRWR
jgi:hypothetical protein